MCYRRAGAPATRRRSAAISRMIRVRVNLATNASRGVRLQQGDIVFVPVHGPRVRLVGGVTRPATYEAREGESLADVITAAGGLRANAGGRRVVIERILPVNDRSTGRERALIDVSLGADGRIPPRSVEDGDVVRVPLVANRVRGRVAVRGHVWSAGPQGFTPGLTLSEALRRAGGLKPDAYIATVHVSRLLADSARVQLRAHSATRPARWSSPSS